MIVAVHIILGVPRRGGTWLFAMTRYIIQETIHRAIAPVVQIPLFLLRMLKLLPKDVRSATEKFNLEAKATVYAVCPKCHSTWQAISVDPIPSYPELCKFTRYKSTCNEQLTRPKKIGKHTVAVPIRKFVSYDFKDFMAALLARPDYEQKMDDSWKDMEPSSNGDITSIFQGSILRDFKGPDGKTHFSVGNGEGRYVFALSFDFFNPLGNKQAGKKVSVGVITLVCLNLPPDVRYKLENMFIAGIVPGPKEPPLERLNPYLTPIVDTFLQFWNTGVYFTRTCLKALGRLVRCAIVGVVCDLPAARKIGGFSSHAHNFFCSVCKCVRHPPKFAADDSFSPWEYYKRKQRRGDNRVEEPSDYEGLDDCQYEMWERRTNEETRAHADNWRNATTANTAQSCFDSSGVRYSELLRLPYFDPSRMIVVDSMHNLFLGLIMEHFRNILGYELERKEKPPPRVFRVPIDMIATPFNGSDHEATSVFKLIKILETPLGLSTEAGFAAAFKKLTVNKMLHPALLYVARSLSIDLGPPTLRKTKTLIAHRILEWVRHQ